MQLSSNLTQLYNFDSDAYTYTLFHDGRPTSKCDENCDTEHDFKYTGYVPGEASFCGASGFGSTTVEGSMMANGSSAQWNE